VRDAHAGHPLASLTEQDIEQAAALTNRACDLGSGSGCIDAAGRYWEGYGVATDIGKSRRLRARGTELLTKECGAGDPDSCWLLAFFSEHGAPKYGVPPDLAAARTLYKLGCQRGQERCCDGARSLGITTAELANGATVSGKPEPKAETGVTAVSPGPADAIIDGWLQAQNEGEFGAYAFLYAPNFVGVKRVGAARKEFDRDGWLADRNKMFDKPMRVTATDRVVERKGDGFVARFRQRWSSGSFADEGTKEIVLRRLDGALLIEREELLDSKVLAK
jgi:ketosteroid isomerase-like protein